MVSGEQKNIRVVVRVRPTNKRESEHNQRTIIKVIDKTTLLFDPDEDDDEFFFQGIKQTHRDITKRVNKKLSMDFDRVFDEQACNTEIFEECTKPLVESLMNGYNCSVFVYGATGAGKTFTMLGNENYQGITFLTIQELFDKINGLRDTQKFDIGVSYLEVYNEQVMNLLTKTGPLKLREDSNGVVVSGLALKPIFTVNELLHLLILGNQNRTQHPTDANSESSRSHAVFQVHIRMTDKKTGQKRMVKLSMIDLAGSERAASTRGIGIRFKEGASINKSLLALGNCINKLADGLKHIPYRDSNLTRLLKDSLGGNCQTLMITNVSPSSLTYEDTYNTLKYASRAKKIRTTIKQIVVKTTKDYYVRKVSEQTDEIEKLKETIKSLEKKVALQESEPTKQFDETEFNSWCRKIDASYSAAIEAHEYYLGLLSKEKILKFRAKIMGYAEVARKALYLDYEKIDGDIGRMQASIDRFGKQIVKQKDDAARWYKRLKESIKDINRLRKEIKEQECSQILEIYIKAKDAELHASKQQVKMSHILKINSLYQADSQHLRSAINLACEIAQGDFHLLRANKLIDTKQEENLSKLAKLISGHQGVRFRNTENGEKDAEMFLDEMSYDGNYSESSGDEKTAGKRKLSSDDDTEVTKLPIKKLFKIDNENDLDINFDDADEIDSQTFKHPSGIGVNKTEAANAVLNISGIQELNSTFSVKENVENCAKQKELINNILTEQNVNAKNRVLISKALINSKARQNLIKAVQVGVNKENKRFSPNRIRKSPRTGKIVTSRAPFAGGFVARPKPNNSAVATTPKTNSSDNKGHVRINRTASLRVKK